MTTILLSGDRGSGKTSLVRSLAAACDGTCAGLISLPVPDAEGRRVGLEVERIGRADRMELAILARRPTTAQAAALLGTPRPDAEVLSDDQILGPWNFRSRSMEAANAWLISDAAASTIILIDEIGPLELEREQGFLRGFRAALASSAALLVVVRPSLRDALVAEIGLTAPERLAGLDHILLDPDARSDSTCEDILAMLRS